MARARAPCPLVILAVERQVRVGTARHACASNTGLVRRLCPPYTSNSPKLRADDGERPGRVVETRRRAVEHAREGPHRGEAECFQKSTHVLFDVGEIDEQRAIERIDCAGHERARDRVVFRDQRPHLSGDAAVAAEREPHDTAAMQRDEFGRRQPTAQAREQEATIGTEGRGVIGADGGPISIGDRANGDTGRRGRRRDCVRALRAAQALKAPRILEAERAVDGAAIGRGVEHRHELGGGEISHGHAQQPRRQSLPAIFARHQHHADPGEAATERKRGGHCYDAAAGGLRGIDTALRDEDTPIGAVLIPAGLAHERIGVGELRRRQRRFDQEREIRSCHRGYRNGCPCRGSACRVRPSRRSSRSA